jgi:hypothetical protein
LTGSSQQGAKNRVVTPKEFKMKYRVHRFELKMTQDQSKLEQFLNSLEGEVISIIPNVTIKAFWVPQVDFVLIIEKLA